jgi:hypothetical protein
VCGLISRSQVWPSAATQFVSCHRGSPRLSSLAIVNFFGNWISLMYRSLASLKPERVPEFGSWKANRAAAPPTKQNRRRNVIKLLSFWDGVQCFAASGLRAGRIINFFGMLPVAPLQYIWTEIYMTGERESPPPPACARQLEFAQFPFQVQICAASVWWLVPGVGGEPSHREMNFFRENGQVSGEMRKMLKLLAPCAE